MFKHFFKILQTYLPVTTYCYMIVPQLLLLIFISGIFN